MFKVSFERFSFDISSNYFYLCVSNSCFQFKTGILNCRASHLAPQSSSVTYTHDFCFCNVPRDWPPLNGALTLCNPGSTFLCLCRVLNLTLSLYSCTVYLVITWWTYNCDCWPYDWERLRGLTVLKNLLILSSMIEW